MPMIKNCEPSIDQGSPLPTPERILHRNPLIKTWQWEKDKTFKGLENVGLTCFVNSVVQCLQYVPMWSNYLWFNHVGECLKPFSQCFACQLSRTTFNLQHKCETHLAPEDLIRMLPVLSTEFTPGTMQDAHEFLICILGKIQESVIDGKVDPYVEMTTAVGRIFGGFLRSQISCLDCLCTSNTYEQYLNLSLDIDGVDSLSEALEKFFAPDRMGGDPWYQCNKCARRTKASKRYTVETRPEVLIVHLKRYDVFGRKLNNEVSFGQSLDLKRFMSSRSDSAPYRMYAALHHVGPSLRWGHYVAFVRDPTEKTSDWFCIDDESVRPSNWSQVMSRTAYMLFYVRV